MTLEKKIIGKAYLIAKNNMAHEDSAMDVVDSIIKLEDDMRLIAELLFLLIDE